MVQAMESGSLPTYHEAIVEAIVEAKPSERKASVPQLRGYKI